MTRKALLAFASAALAVGCDKRSDTTHPPAPPASSAPSAEAPPIPTFDPAALAAFAPLPDAVAEPVMDDVAELGHKLFFDPRLSGDKALSCSSCHDLARGGADDKPASAGPKGSVGRFNTPTVLNAAGAYAQGWTASASTVEELVVPHVLDPTVMGMPDEKRLAQSLASAYAGAFKKAFPEDKPSLSAETVARALSAYVAKLFTRSRWDAFVAGDHGKLTEEERAGFAAFVDAGCTACHQGKHLGAAQAQKLGIAKPWPGQAGADPGRFAITKEEVDRGVFKVPTLRNVARTAPYLHDGSVGTLDEVVRLMARHQVGRELSDERVRAIVRFLGALDGDAPAAVAAKPTLPR